MFAGSLSGGVYFDSNIAIVKLQVSHHKKLEPELSVMHYDSECLCYTVRRYNNAADGF